MPNVQFKKSPRVLTGAEVHEPTSQPLRLSQYEGWRNALWPALANFCWHLFQAHPTLSDLQMETLEPATREYRVSPCRQCRRWVAAVYVKAIGANNVVSCWLVICPCSVTTTIIDSRSESEKKAQTVVLLCLLVRDYSARVEFGPRRNYPPFLKPLISVHDSQDKAYPDSVWPVLPSASSRNDV
jgi:hypothetical protein